MKNVPTIEWTTLWNSGHPPYYGMIDGESEYSVQRDLFQEGKWMVNHEGPSLPPFDSEQEAKDWCQQDYTAWLKAAEKWTSQPPVEPGDYFILPPHSLRSAITCGAWQIQQFKERPGYWPKGTLFRKIDEPEEPYDFSNT